jgi:hypothetical protein
MSVILITVPLFLCQLVSVSKRQTKHIVGRMMLLPTRSYLMLPATPASRLSEPHGASQSIFRKKGHIFILRLRNRK